MISSALCPGDGGAVLARALPEPLHGGAGVPAVLAMAGEGPPQLQLDLGVRVADWSGELRGSEWNRTHGSHGTA